jgi:predicted acylesterase/phospholipase RssA
MLRGLPILALTLFLFIAAAPGSLARAEALPFYKDEAILSVAEPILIGEEAFSRRAAALAEGGEPFGLVLSGGSARAFAHIGVLEVLEEEGIRPDFLVADSMGAIIALLYCAGLAPADIAALFDAFPANELFDPEFPLSGGFLDAGRFIALVRALVGDLDLADLPIPALIACEDLLSRRQVLIAEGDFSKVAAASFALPAVFEPVPFRGLLLIDGGVTSLVPVEAAYRYSGKVAAATALYGRKMDYSSPFVVINRALDIGKTRSSVEGMLERKPVVIRCDVESLSYMQFSHPAEVTARGRASARAALDELRTIAPSGRGPNAVLDERRAYYHERVGRLAAAARLGASFPVPADMLVEADARFLDEAAGGVEVLAGRRWIGPEAELRAGAVRLSLSALAGLEGREERTWGLGCKAGLGGYLFPSREKRESGLALEAGLQAVLSGSGALDAGVSRPEPHELAAVASGGAAFAFLRGLIFRPAVSAELDQTIKGEDSFRRVAGALGFELRPWSRLGLDLGTELALDSDENIGPGASFALDWEPADPAALRLRAIYRAVFEGPGIEAPAADPYRSEKLGGRAERRFLGGAEAVWIARPLEASFGELMIIERPELGFYADLAGADMADDSGGSFETRLTIGATASAGLSIMGLAPMVFSAFVGAATDGSGWVFGLRAGRSFN